MKKLRVLLALAMCIMLFIIPAGQVFADQEFEDAQNQPVQEAEGQDIEADPQIEIEGNEADQIIEEIQPEAPVQEQAVSEEVSDEQEEEPEELPPEPAAVGKVRVRSVNGTTGSFSLVGSEVSSSYDGVKKVQFLVWRNADKSDRKWYTGKIQKNGTYTASGNVKNHKRHFGTYKVYMYVTNGQDKRISVSHVNMAIKASNYTYARKAASNNTKYKIIILNPNKDGKAARKVKVRTWSNKNGKNDAKVYTAKKTSGSSWSVTVNVRKHKHGGKFTSVVYVDSKRVRTVTYKMTLDSVRARLYKYANTQSSATSWLVVVDKKQHRVGIFTGKKGNWTIQKNWPCGDGKASTPTPEGVFRIGTKGPYFDSGSARCYYFTNFYPHYYFHSVLCNPNTGTPYSGTQLGIGVSHGCVRLAKPNALWLMNNVPYGTTVYIFH